MSKNTNEKAGKWLSPSALEKKCFHTPIGLWCPKMEFPPLALYDTRENLFYIWKVNPELDGFPIELPGRVLSSLDHELSALKMAYLHLSIALQLYSSILPLGYARISIFYTPSLRHPKLPEDEAWGKWHNSHHKKQPLVERLCIENDEQIKICWDVSPQKLFSDFLSLPPNLGFLKHLHFAIQSYNTWLMRASNAFDLVIIPAYFEFGLFPLMYPWLIKDIPVFEF